MRNRMVQGYGFGKLGRGRRARRSRPAVMFVLPVEQVKRPVRRASHPTEFLYGALAQGAQIGHGPQVDGKPRQLVEKFGG